MNTLRRGIIHVMVACKKGKLELELELELELD